MTLNKKDLETEIRTILPEIKALRRRLHTMPETGFEERHTIAEIHRALAPLHLKEENPILPTAGVFRLDGAASGRNVTLRSDIDALATVDESGTDWQSCHPGFSHACGHDGHMAILTGTAITLHALRANLQGSIRFVYQPAEESVGGGKQMVSKGLLDTAPRPDAVFALHGWPGMPVGTLAAGAGPMMAAADLFSLTIKGKGSHGARPHNSVDPIMIGAELVNSLQTVISRNIDPVKPAVLSVCQFTAGSTPNVIPDSVYMQGTVRYFEAGLKTFIRTRMEALIAGTCAMHGADYAFDYLDGYIPLENDPSMDAMAEQTLPPLGINWQRHPEPNMTGEDFAYYLQKTPGVMLRLGLGTDHPDLHSSDFDFNDDALYYGILALSALTLKILGTEIT